jgi:hypothetical protein
MRPRPDFEHRTIRTGVIAMANAITEPPSTDPHSSRYLVGQDSRGRWVVQGTRGLSGGLFINQREARRYALLETGNHPENVILVPGVLELDMSRKADIAPLQPLNSDASHADALPARGIESSPAAKAA